MISGRESLSRIFAVAVRLPAVSVAVLVDSTVLSSVVSYVTVNEETPFGTNMVPSTVLKVTPFENATLVTVESVLPILYA